MLEPAVEPGQDGFGPEDPFVVCHDVMILIQYLNVLYLPSQYFQGGKQLRALPRRHVGIDRTVEQQ